MVGHTSTQSEELTRADVEQRLLSKAVQDEAFRQALVQDSEAIWQQEFGTTDLKELQLLVLQETQDSLYLVLPSGDEAFRKELTEHPQAVWQREFGKAPLKGYTIRVVEEPPGRFFLVLPDLDRVPAWVQASQSSTHPSAFNSLAQQGQNASNQVKQSYRSWMYRRYPKTKLGRIFYYTQSWVVVMVISNPVVTSILSPFYITRNWLNAWRRL